MKSFACVVLLAAAAALAAPEGAREKRGFLSGSLAYSHDFGHDHFEDYHPGLGSLAHAALHDHAPARIVSVDRVVVPKVVEVRRLVAVPRVVKVARVLEEPHVHHYSYARAPLTSGWW